MKATFEVKIDFKSNDPGEVDKVMRELEYHFRVHSEVKYKHIEFPRPELKVECPFTVNRDNPTIKDNYNCTYQMSYSCSYRNGIYCNCEE